MSDQEPRKLVIAHYALSRSEAELIRILLEENGVDALVPDQNTPYPGVDLTPFSSAGGAGCDVYVRAEYAERARFIIQASRDASQRELSEKMASLDQKVSDLDRKFAEFDRRLGKGTDPSD